MKRVIFFLIFTITLVLLNSCTENNTPRIDISCNTDNECIYGKDDSNFCMYLNAESKVIIENPEAYVKNECKCVNNVCEERIRCEGVGSESFGAICLNSSYIEIDVGKEANVEFIIRNRMDSIINYHLNYFVITPENKTNLLILTPNYALKRILNPIITPKIY